MKLIKNIAVSLSMLLLLGSASAQQTTDGTEQQTEKALHQKVQRNELAEHKARRAEQEAQKVSQREQAKAKIKQMVKKK